MSFKLGFICSKDEAKYEALDYMAHLNLTYGIRELQMRDFMPIIKQVNREFILKEITLVSYHTAVIS